jgi:uncharacterized damage-inducible protein DinB
MDGPAAVSALRNMKAFFDRTSSCFEERDSGFAPRPEMFTVAQHVAHTAFTVDWFVEGVFGSRGFDMDFAAHEREVRRVTSLAEARAWWERSTKAVIDAVGAKSAAELAEPLPKGSLMAGAPRHSIVSGLVDHTAHHRGALAAYARLAGKVPPMPYR